MAEWSERIPPAIEKGEAFFAEVNPNTLSALQGAFTYGAWLTRGEVALAKALWDEIPANHSFPDGVPCEISMDGVSDACLTCDPCMALRDFTEKVEAL